MSELKISRMKIKGQIYDIEAMTAKKAEEAGIADKTKGKLTIGTIEFNGSTDVEVPVYEGEQE